MGRESSTSENIVVRVQRYDPARDKVPRYETYAIPRSEVAIVGDVLNYIYEKLDGSLAFRWECRVKLCGTCTVLVNGRPVLACKEPVSPNMTIEPISERVSQAKVVRDLVVDRSDLLKRLDVIGTITRHDETQTDQPDEISPSKVKELRIPGECIRCMACVTACPVVTSSPSYLGPAALVKAYRWIRDPRDPAARDKLSAIDEERSGVWRCRGVGNCQIVCPAEIPITDHIASLRRAIIKESFR